MDEVKKVEGDDYKRSTEENWDLRPDVAGFEYPGYPNWRIGIIRDVIESPAGIQIIETILQTPFDTSEDNMVTRNMARAIVRRDILDDPQLQALLSDLEVIIPLEQSGNPAFKDCYQIIISRNHESRQTPPETIQHEIAEAEKVFAEGKKFLQTRELKPLPDGITIELVTADSDPEVINSYTAIISDSFDEDADDIAEGIASEDELNFAAVLRKPGEVPVVIGTVYATKDEDVLRRGGVNKTLTTFEVTGAKVSDEYTGQGIYKHLCNHLYQRIAMQPQVDMVIGYSNAEEPAVIKIAAQMGRESVIETAHRLGLPIRPAMQQTVTDGKLVDEVVTYMPGEKLRSLYGIDRTQD